MVVRLFLWNQGLGYLSRSNIKVIFFNKKKNKKLLTFAITLTWKTKSFHTSHDCVVRPFLAYQGQGQA